MAKTRHEPVRTGEKQDVVVTGKPLTDKQGTIKVTYNPGPGDPDETEIFGKKAKKGEAVEVPAKHADKVRGNRHLSLDGEKPFAAEEANVKPVEQKEASFEQNLARERSEEYLQDRTLPAAPPGEAERVARAQAAARALQEATESEDKDKPRTGRGKA